jgi:hypothetical protein
MMVIVGVVMVVVMILMMVMIVRMVTMVMVTTVAGGGCVDLRVSLQHAGVCSPRVRS